MSAVMISPSPMLVIALPVLSSWREARSFFVNWGLPIRSIAVQTWGSSVPSRLIASPLKPLARAARAWLRKLGASRNQTSWLTPSSV